MSGRIYLIRGALYAPSKPVRDAQYLAFVRKLGYCLACGSSRGIEAAHTGPHGMSQKASDDTAVNLCHRCHRTGPHALHRIGPVAFAEHFALDIQAHIAKLRGFYLARKKAA